jgi:hypothetical protein
MKGVAVLSTKDVLDLILKTIIATCTLLSVIVAIIALID